MVRQIHQQGTFSDKERRRYSHFRNHVKERCGLLKPNITMLPNLNFRLQDYLIDPESALEFDNDSQNPTNLLKSGRPNPAMLPNLLGKGGKGKGRFRQMKKRLKSADNHSKVQQNLRIVRSDPNYKRFLFAELAKQHRAVKASGDLKQAKKIKRQILLKLRAL